MQRKTILITRPRAQAEEFAAAISEAGFEPVFFPAIEIKPPQDLRCLDQALAQLESYDWIVLTSVNGVEAVWERLEALGRKSLPPGLNVAAIGPKTAAALQNRGTKPDFVPDEYVAEAILPGLGELLGKRVLLPRARTARRALAEAIRQAGGEADEIAAYDTVPAGPAPEGLKALRIGVAAVTFTSSSTVLSFIDLALEAGLDPRNLPGNPLLACIGPITAETAQHAGLPVGLVAAEYTTSGLLRAMMEYFARTSI